MNNELIARIDALIIDTALSFVMHNALIADSPSSNLERSLQTLRDCKAALSKQSEPVDRTCGNGECGWVGKTDRMCGEIGPLCPECGETTEPVASSQQDGWTFDELDLRGPADFEAAPPEGWESSDWRTCLELKAELHNKKVYRAEIRRLRAALSEPVASVPQVKLTLSDFAPLVESATTTKELQAILHLIDNSYRQNLTDFAPDDWPKMSVMMSNRKEAVAKVIPSSRDVELNQILGEYLTEELAAVAPDIDWYDGKYMDGLVSGIIDVVMSGHARVPEDADPLPDNYSSWDVGYNEGWNACREAMLTASKELHNE